MLNLTIFGLILVLLSGCSNNGKTPRADETGQKQIVTETRESSSVHFSGSVNSVDSGIEDLILARNAKQEHINYLKEKRDSMLMASKQLKISMDKISSEKITPEVESVNLKLDELESQKDKLFEKRNLQRKEVVLTEKKIVFQNQNKNANLAVRRTLLEKKAPHTEIITVDSLLSGIEKKLNEQTKQLNNLNRSISDIDENISTIDLQKNSLNNKIRNNYTTQKIYIEFTDEEIIRLEKLIYKVEDQIKNTLIELEDLNNRIGLLADDKINFELNQNEAGIHQIRNTEKQE